MSLPKHFAHIGEKPIPPHLRQLPRVKIPTWHFHLPLTPPPHPPTPIPSPFPWSHGYTITHTPFVCVQYEGVGLLSEDHLPQSMTQPVHSCNYPHFHHPLSRPPTPPPLIYNHLPPPLSRPPPLICYRLPSPFPTPYHHHPLSLTCCCSRQH